MTNRSGTVEHVHACMHMHTQVTNRSGTLALDGLHVPREASGEEVLTLNP